MSETFDESDRPWGGTGDRIRYVRPAIRKHMNVFVEGERAGLETLLAPGAEVYVLTGDQRGEALVVKIRRLAPGRGLPGADAKRAIQQLIKRSRILT